MKWVEDLNAKVEDSVSRRRIFFTGIVWRPGRASYSLPGSGRERARAGYKSCPLRRAARLGGANTRSLLPGR